MAARARKLVTLLALGLVGAACASEPARPLVCDTDQSTRPLGRRFLPFFAWLESRPAATREELVHRGSLFDDDCARFAARRGDEVDDTAEHFSGFGGTLSREFSHRNDEQSQYLHWQGDRLREDSQCFWSRAWYSLKLIE